MLKIKLIDLFYVLPDQTIEKISKEYSNIQLKQKEQILTQRIIKKLNDKVTNLQQENDYLKDIVLKTELSDEIKKADKYSKRELYKINYQRLKANQRLQQENDRLEVLRQECADEILKELEENNHLSCGVALAIRQKLIDYKEVR